MATRTQIVEKAYKCLDEVYPDTPLSSDIDEFHIEDFVDDAIRFIGRVAPVRALGAGISFVPKQEDKPQEGENTTSQTDNDSHLRVNPVPLPSGFVRLIAFQMSDWALPITDALYSDNPRYRQQADPILMGTPKRPVVFICDGGSNLEYYSSTGTIKKAQAFVVSSTENYPEQLSSVIAWKTAELVLSAMNDAQGLQFAQNQIQQQLQAL
ncbi:MAG: hypothetical protein IKU93_02745 [Alistipes sp.]|nr:hypothetical protein [Alistipes sp.]